MKPDGTLLPSLKSARLSRSRKKKAIAIVTLDFMGPKINGGVGTAYLALAETLAKSGHDVTVILTDREHHMNFEVPRWKQIYAARGINLMQLPPSQLNLSCYDPAKISYDTYLYLKENYFEIVHFPDLHGVGYYSLLAKKQGLAFHSTKLVVTLHGPISWHSFHNRQFLECSDDLVRSFLERKSVELAEILIAPSQYIVNWCQQQGWILPKDVYVEQNLLTSTAQGHYSGDPKRFDEIVFFGRLETRKGLDVFCDALDLLSPTTLRDRTITFLGGFGTTDFKYSEKYLNERARNWPFRWQVIYDLGQEEALEYLTARNVLAVIPSRSETLGYTVMECLASKIPFIASDIPAFRELIAENDQDSVFFHGSGSALSKKIEEIVNQGFRQVGFAVPPTQTRNNWVRWHSNVTIEKKRAPSLVHTPAITVCVSHRNRPEYLLQCLESLQNQTYKDFEILVLDDASDIPGIGAVLKSLRKKKNRIRCRVYESKKRLGSSGLRNKVLDLPSREYLLFMDDDNIAKPQEIETFVKALKQTSADILTCPYDTFRGDLPPLEGQQPESRWLPIGASISLGVLGNCFGDMNSLIKRNVFKSLNGLRGKKGAAAEDYDFFARATLAGYKLEVIPEALFWYRCHKGNFSSHADIFETASLGRSAYSMLLPDPDFLSVLAMGMINKEPGIPTKAKKRLTSAEDFADGLFNQRKYFKTSLVSIVGNQLFSNLKAEKKLSIESKPNYLLITAAKENLGFHLQKLSSKATDKILLELCLLSMKASHLHVEYSKKCSGKIRRTRLTRFYDKGRNIVQIVLDRPQPGTLIRVVPMTSPGSVVLQKLELLRWE